MMPSVSLIDLFYRCPSTSGPFALQCLRILSLPASLRSIRPALLSDFRCQPHRQVDTRSPIFIRRNHIRNSNLFFNIVSMNVSKVYFTIQYYFLKRSQSTPFNIYTSSIAFPISCLIYLFPNSTHSVARYALALASFRSFPFAVTPNTRPPFVTMSPSASNLLPAWNT